MVFTDEQKEFLGYAHDGKDVLVDACIGSGKTTAIQAACDVIHGKVLYLTYNRRLLEEARRRITDSNVHVHTFHSFAGSMLTMANIGANSEREVIPQFIAHMKRIYKYDAVVVDEYQDLSEDLKDMLWHICRMSYNNYGFCPQFLIVGDKDQKISDNTSIDAVASVHELLDFLDKVHNEKHIEMQFTNCFRLSADYAAEIGQAWGKSIIGLNPNCTIDDMNVDDVVQFLFGFEPEDILVLGSNMSFGARIEIQNELERGWPNKFNKNTVYSSISDNDGSTRRMDTSKCAIFTTFDSAKGLERKVCVVCDYTPKYLEARMKHQTSRAVLKNLFLVAASRGKEYNIFCMKGISDRLEFDAVARISGKAPVDMTPAYMSDMFNYQIREDVDACLECLEIETTTEPGDIIKAEQRDGNIDISVCQGIYAQACYFRNYDIDFTVDMAWNEYVAKGRFIKLPEYHRDWPLWRKVLFLMAIETGQERYVKQVKESYIDDDNTKALEDRLRSMFDEFAPVERTCTLIYKNCMAVGYTVADKMIRGRCDLLVDDIPWELKFVEDLKGEHALQAAMYAAAFNSDYAMLYNMRNGEARKVVIKDRAEFLRRVLACISRHKLECGMAAVRGDVIELDNSGDNTTDDIADNFDNNEENQEAV